MKTKLIRPFTTAIVLFLGVTNAFAETGSFGNANISGSGNGSQYWVDINATNASDAGPGTQAQPWKTFKYASATAMAGDTVNVMPGVYTDTEPQSSGTLWRAFNPANSGTEGNPITFRSVVPRAAILKSSAPDTDKAYRDPALAFYSRSDIIYDGFKTSGMVRFVGSERINFINGEVTVGSVAWNDPSLFWGIAIERVHHSVIRNNKVHEMTVALKNGVANTQSNQAGIMVFGGGGDDVTTNNLIENNYVDVGNNVFAGIGNKGGGLKNNLWQKNFVKNAEVGILTIGSTDLTRDVEDSYYLNNIIVDSKVGIALENNSLNTRIINNTFVRNESAIRFIAFNSTGTELINNAVYDTESYINAHGYWGDPGLELEDMFDTADYNQFEQLDYWAVRESPGSIRAASIADLQALGLENNSLVSPLNFVNPSGTEPEDFKRTAYPNEGMGGVYSTVIGAYESNGGVVGTFEIPEPTSAVLSVLAAMSLFARRRRR